MGLMGLMGRGGWGGLGGGRTRRWRRGPCRISSGSSAAPGSGARECRTPFPHYTPGRRGAQAEKSKKPFAGASPLFVRWPRIVSQPESHAKSAKDAKEQPRKQGDEAEKGRASGGLFRWGVCSSEGFCRPFRAWISALERTGGFAALHPRLYSAAASRLERRLGWNNPARTMETRPFARDWSGGGGGPVNR